MDKIIDLKNKYWLKSELIAYCKARGFSTQGSKQDLIERIELFFSTGKKSKSVSMKVSKKDSDQPITLNTPVIHYKNDAKTRDFFIKQIGPHFHFTRYLRQFTDINNIAKSLTYGDLVKGWLEEFDNKKNTKSNISSQFQYNQFIRDFFKNESNKTLQDAINAWNKVKEVAGPKTYVFYKKLTLP